MEAVKVADAHQPQAPQGLRKGAVAGVVDGFAAVWHMKADPALQLQRFFPVGLIAV
jgi:hypothetical protein